ncbi:MAG: hypothetical protein IJY06_04825 [Oscillospiraceae bacterium]|jgi:hypothetical protein|nr:hypothetical protein [Oscillospiraceae bacterium]MBQ9110671.1 hypothetical protein [Oscillospiraceae bacterium]
MHPKLKRCFQFGQYANILFLVFTFVCLLYYWLIKRYQNEVVLLEIAAYAIEVGGFGMMLLSLLYFWKIVRHRYIMKAAMLIYLITEVVIMIMDFNAERIPFYQSNSMALNIGHSIFSAVICFTYLSLEPKNTALEVAIVLAVTIILMGMFGTIFKMNVYISLFANSIAYVVLFSILRFLHSQERIMVDCHGDRAREQKFKSTFFDDL